MVLGPPGRTYLLFFLLLATTAGVFPPLGAAVLAGPVPSSLLGADRSRQAVFRSRCLVRGCRLVGVYLLLLGLPAGIAGSCLAIRGFLAPPMLARWCLQLVDD